MLWERNVFKFEHFLKLRFNFQLGLKLASHPRRSFYKKCCSKHLPSRAYIFQTGIYYGFLKVLTFPCLWIVRTVAIRHIGQEGRKSRLKLDLKRSCQVWNFHVLDFPCSMCSASNPKDWNVTQRIILGLSFIFLSFCFRQYTLATDAFQLGYTEDGHCKGEVERSLPPPQRLVWDIPSEVGNPCWCKKKKKLT